MPTATTLIPEHGPVVADPVGLPPNQPAFHATDLDQVCEHLSGAIAPHKLSYTTRSRGLDFLHRGAALGAMTLNDMQYGGDVTIAAPDFGNYYLLQFMLEGRCRLTQAGATFDMAAGTVALVNPCQPFTKAWSADGRQLLIRIERNALDREMRTWTGRDRSIPIEFDPLALEFEKAGTLLRLLRVICDDIGKKSSDLGHPFLRDRLVSALASSLLLAVPHNQIDALQASGSSIAPACVRRAERFMEENAREPIGLADIAVAAGVSARALQSGFRRIRDSTPMARLREIRLELARADLAQTTGDGGSVASIANRYGFAHLGRFAADYRARFNECPSETLRRRRM